MFWLLLQFEHFRYQSSALLHMNNETWIGLDWILCLVNMKCRIHILKTNFRSETLEEDRTWTQLVKVCHEEFFFPFWKSEMKKVHRNKQAQDPNCIKNMNTKHFKISFIFSSAQHVFCHVLHCFMICLSDLYCSVFLFLSFFIFSSYLSHFW